MQHVPPPLDILRPVIEQVGQAALPGIQLQPFLDDLRRVLHEQWPDLSRVDIYLQAGDNVPVAPELGTNGWSLPLVAGDRVNGVLAVEFAEGASIPPVFKTGLTALAGSIALAIERLQTVPLTRALGLGQQLAAAHLPQDMAGILAEYVGEGCSLIDITLYEYANNTPVRARAVVLSLAGTSELTDFSTDMDDYPLGAAITTLEQGQPVRIDDVYTTRLIDPDRHSYFQAQNIQSLTVVPLMFEQHLIGAVSVAGRQLSSHELQGLQTLSNQIAAIVHSQSRLTHTTGALDEAQQLYRFSSAILDAKDPASLIQAVYAQFGTPPDVLALEAITTSTGEPGAVLGITTEAGTTAQGAIEHSALAAARTEYLTHCITALQNGTPYIVNNLATDPDISPQARTYFSNWNVKALSVFPIMLDGMLTHAVTAAYHTPHIYTPGEIHLLQRLSEQIGLQASNWALLRQTQDQTQRLTQQIRLLESLYETARQVSTSLASTATLKTTCQTLAETLRMDYVAIIQFDMDSGTLRTEHPTRLGPDTTLSLIGFAAYQQLEKSQEPLVVEPANALLLGSNQKYFESLGVQSILIAPLLAQGNLLGMLVLATGEPDRMFSQEEIQVAQALATQIATSLQNAELFGEIQRRASQLERIGAFGRLVTSTLEWDQILRHIVDVIPNLIVAEHISLALYASGESRMRQITLSSSEPPKETHLSVAGTGIDEVVRTQTPLLITDLPTSTYTDHKSLAEQGFQSALIAPLTVGGRTMGAIMISHTRPQIHTPTDLTLLQQVGNQIAIALENALRFKTAEQRAQYEEALSEITSRLQQQADLHDLLHQTMQDLGGALGARRARVRLQTRTEQNHA